MLFYHGIQQIDCVDPVRKNGCHVNLTPQIKVLHGQIKINNCVKTNSNLRNSKIEIVDEIK